MTKKRRGEEEWAREMIQQALGVAVVQHDDGSTPRMYDLKILHDGRENPGRPCLACEASRRARRRR